MMRTSTVLVVCVAALLLSSCQAARGRHLSQAIATANSVAGPGETVNSDSKATSEKGQLTVSNVNAKGSGPGTTVNCEQEAKNGQIKSKECGGTGASNAAGGAANAKAQVASWATAPVCKKDFKTYTVVKDAQGNPWSSDDGVSCALRGKPLR